jgi:hypothetical protein
MADMKRADVEDKRLKIEAADVLVRALEVAAAAGVHPDELLGAVQGLTERLLPEKVPASIPAARQVVDKHRANLPALPGPPRAMSPQEREAGIQALLARSRGRHKKRG